MTDLATLSATVAGAAPTRLNPAKLFMDADIVVQLVMAGLLLASIWVWMIIVSFSLRMGGVRRRCAAYEKDLWAKVDNRSAGELKPKSESAAARVVAAGLEEWRLSGEAGGRDPAGARQRIAGAMESQVAFEADSLAERLNFLATVGSVAPFVGLFGTVWGIMNSFFQIGSQQNSSLAVVAPGISEALFATAIGLFAAIPAVIAYNRFSQQVNALEARLQRLADKVHAMLGREMDAR
ncbi:protein TolQ [Croceicoccus estronivorus]|uniref:protein TolQ n=1 Tax=Croceicoccus estronivorus TaxID=1172626 RepID=UPI00082A295A|nr:protein TolQ [Croceicoccus estronivorus]OCC23651.1 protein TolQ [Croceicoccus estronivorus]